MDTTLNGRTTDQATERPRPGLGLATVAIAIAALAIGQMVVWTIVSALS